MAAADKEFEQAHALRQKLTQRDLLAAIRLFVDSARQFSALGSRQKAAFAEIEAGDTYQMMSSYQQALAAYRQSLALSVGLPEPRCTVLAHVAHTYANIGRSQDAEPYSDEAITLCESLSDAKALAYALEVQGEVRFWSGSPKDAVTPFARAIKLASDANDRDTEALSTMMLAELTHDSDREQSHRSLQTALDLWTGARNDYGAARAYLQMAYFAGDEGNFGAAHCLCEKALPVFQRIADKDNIAVALNILGLVARESGDFETAFDDYRQARKDFVAVRDKLGEADSITGMADVLVNQNQYGSLLPLYTRVLDLVRITQNRAHLASALVSTADLYRHAHRYVQADTYYQRGLNEYHAAANLNGEGLTQMRRAELMTEQGNFQLAIDQLHQAQSQKELAGEVENLAKIQYSLARSYLRLNQLPDALTEIKKTIDIIELQRLRISKYDTRAQYFASVHEYYSLYIQVLMELHKLHPHEGYEQRAFEAAEKSKVRALLDRLENSREASSCDKLLAGGSNPGVAKRSEPLTNSLDAASAQPLTLAEINTEIGDGETVLLEYAVGEDRSYAWLIDGERITAYDLGPTVEIRNRVRMFREALVPLHEHVDESPINYLRRRRAAKDALLFQSRRLASLLLGPVHLPQKRVLIVPDGPLQYLPFAALSESETGEEATPLIAQHELTMLPSASVLAVLRKAAAKRPPPMDEITVFADPIFERTESTAPHTIAIATGSQRPHDLKRALSDSQGSQHIPRLPGSRSEALAIQQIIGSARTRLALGFDASRKAVIDGSLARQRIIHFATHGIVDTLNPEMSGLVLSLLNDRGEYQDGYLRLSDIYNLKLSADLVVLSSCESALGKDLGSEGIIGLPRGFLYAGAHRVIASLWKVDDDATAVLMTALYSRMQRGESANKALRGAQLDLLKNKRFSEPYYWAAFVLEGDYK